MNCSRSFARRVFAPDAAAPDFAIAGSARAADRIGDLPQRHLRQLPQCARRHLSGGPAARRRAVLQRRRRCVRPRASVGQRRPQRLWRRVRRFSRRLSACRGSAVSPRRRAAGVGDRRGAARGRSRAVPATVLAALAARRAGASAELELRLAIHRAGWSRRPFRSCASGRRTSPMERRRRGRSRRRRRRAPRAPRRRWRDARARSPPASTRFWRRWRQTRRSAPRSTPRSAAERRLRSRRRAALAHRRWTRSIVGRGRSPVLSATRNPGGRGNGHDRPGCRCARRRATPTIPSPP